MNSLMAAPVSIATTRTSNATCVATVTAPAARNAVAIFGLLITASAVPTAAVEAVLTDGTTTLTINLPATVLPGGFVFNFPAGHPFVALPATAVTLTVPALGAAPVLCNASLFYSYVTT
jgi:hypothetical protein